MDISIKHSRNAGIELLRIVSMFAIIIMHVLGQGGILNVAPALSKNYEAAWFMEIMCYFGVTAYALISGYALYEGNYHPSNIVYLWLQVFFYSALTTIGFLIFMPEVVNIIAINLAIMPITNESYWYFSAYAGLFFLIPGLKYIVKNLKKSTLDFMLFGMILLWSVGQVLPATDVFGLKNGASFVWLMACFILGAYIKKYDVFSKLSSKILVILYFAGVLLTFLSKYGIEAIYGEANWNIDRANLLVKYNSPTVLLSAVSMVVLFSRFNFSEKVSKTICFIAPLTFGVYLANSQPLTWAFIMRNRFGEYSTYPVWKLVICTLCTAAVIFLIGICIDAIRNLIFEMLHLRERLRAVEKVISDRLEAKMEKP